VNAPTDLDRELMRRDCAAAGIPPTPDPRVAAIVLAFTGRDTGARRPRHDSLHTTATLVTATQRKGRHDSTP